MVKKGAENRDPWRTVVRVVRALAVLITAVAALVAALIRG